jgi:hypothetical protein
MIRINTVASTVPKNGDVNVPKNGDVIERLAGPMSCRRLLALARPPGRRAADEDRVIPAGTGHWGTGCTPSMRFMRAGRGAHKSSAAYLEYRRPRQYASRFPAPQPEYRVLDQFWLSRSALIAHRVLGFPLHDPPVVYRDDPAPRLAAPERRTPRMQSILRTGILTSAGVAIVTIAVVLCLPFHSSGCSA